MSNEVELKAIANLVKHSREHGLEVECIWSLIHEVIGVAINNNVNGVDSDEIASACTHALCEWDI